MANIIIQGGTSGTGSTTITAPSTNNTNAITLPDTTGGSIMVSSNMPAFSAYANLAQTISASTFTKLQINTKNFDTNNYFDATTNYRFTPLIAGYYQINALAYFPLGSASSASISLYKNGAQIIQTPTTTNGPFSFSLNQIIYLNGTTDYIEVYVSSATSFTTIASRPDLYNFSGCLLRTA